MRIAALCALLLCVGAILYFGLISDAALPDHRLIRGNNDLVFHALAFAALTVPCWVLLGPIRGTAVVWGMILAVEAAQLPIAGREASIEDIASGLAGWLIVAVSLVVFRKAV